MNFVYTHIPESIKNFLTSIFFKCTDNKLKIEIKQKKRGI